MMAVQPEKILKELANLWVSIGEEEGVLRACAMTLVVIADGTDDVGESIAELMREHPSRAIVVRIVDEPEPRLESRVFAQCWMPFGRRQQICCEQIEITSTPSRLEDVHSALLGLAVPDLPVILWLRHQAMLTRPEFQSVLRIARTVIADSKYWTDGVAAMEAMRKAHAAGWRIKDLSWTRTTRWREIIAQAFENQCARAAGVERITIQYASGDVPVKARYLEAWLAARLPGVATGFARTEKVLHNELQGLVLEGTGMHLSIQAADGCSADVRVAEHTRRVVFPEIDEWQLVEEELSILGNDPVFDETLELACERAGRI